MNHFFAIEVFIDTLYRAGVRHIVLSPGSRSTPLTVYADRHPGLATRIIIDERSAAFCALGMAKRLNAPVGIVCTSGTAAANYLPAVVEAYYARVPLVVMTADRPHEARDLGAPQTIDQVRLFGGHVKWFADLPLPKSNLESVRYFAAAGARAVLESTATPQGPVHLNVPLREPLTPPENSLMEAWAHASPALSAPASLSPNFVPPAPPSASPLDVAALAEQLAQYERGLLVCGPTSQGFPADVVVRLAERLSLPILADPLSGVRYGSHSREHVVDTYDMVLRAPSCRKALRPDYVIRLGALPTSKPLNLFLKEQTERHFIVDPAGWNDALLSANQMVRADPVQFCAQLADALEVREVGAAAGAQPRYRAEARESGQSASPWLRRWQALNRLARRELDDAAGSEADLFEGQVFTELTRLLPADAVLFVGNSMPVRDLDLFLGSSSKPLHPMANRGANGIDGVVSTALGSAIAAERPGALVLGDLSLLHDVGGLMAAGMCRTPFVIIAVNNDGGGIFSFLPQAQEAQNFERLFGTPHGLEFAHAAAFYGVGYARPQAWDEFRAAVQEAFATAGVTIIELPSERQRNLSAHRRIEARLLKRLQEFQGAAEKLDTGAATAPEGGSP